MTVRVALAGLGYWGPNLARNLASTGGALLHTLCDAREERLTALGRDFPSALRRTDYARVLDDPEVDAVVLATPVQAHFGMARAALSAGKHVMVEKPLARSSAECRELIALAASRKLVLMSGHVFIYNPAVRWVKAFLEAGELGELHYVCSQRLNLGIVRQDVNALWNFAPHDLSILNFWLGAAPEAAVARGYSYVQPGIEDVVFLTLDYPRGVGAHVHLSWLDPRKVRTMTLVGSRKMVVYDDVSADAKIMVYDKGITRSPRPAEGESPLGRHRDFGQFQLLLRAGDVVIPRIDFSEPLREECRHFVDCVAGGARPLTDGEEGLRVVQALEAAQQSLELRGHRVEIRA